MRPILAFILAAAASAAQAADPAAGGGLHAFTPPAGDVSVEFLRQIFGSIIGGDGEPNSTLGAMMSVFNTAVLFLAMLFVFYTTVKGTVDSAHDGVLLGKKMSEIWVPIRTVGGTALLLPLASGFSLIQVAVLWLALQGVGVASQVWSATISTFAQTGTLGSVSVPDARPLAASILRASVCAAAMNKQYEGEARAQRIEAKAHTVNLLGGGAITEYRWSLNDRSTSAAACGSLQWSDNPNQERASLASSKMSRTRTAGDLEIVRPLLQAHSRAVQTMIDELRPVAEQIVATWQKPPAGTLEGAASRYEQAIQAAAKQAVDAAPQIAEQSFLQEAETGGWILAGTWLQHMTRLNDAVQGGVNTVPVSKPSRIEDLEVKETLQTYHDALTMTDEFLLDRSGAPRRAYDLSVEDAKNLRGVDDVWKLLSVPAMAGLDALTSRIAGANTSPVEQLRVIGNDTVLIGTAIKAAQFAIAGFAGSRAADWTVGNVFSVTEALKTISGTVEFLSTALWGLGLVLGVYLPAVPTIWWVAGVIRWLASVAEAVMAAPLMAAMHLHPGGDDFVGRAGPGYMLILAMVIQPALLVIGFILCAALLYPAGALVNMMFLGMVAGVTGSGGVGLVAVLAWAALYVGMMTMAVHGCFALISTVPDNIMRWVGSQAGAHGVGIREVEKTVGGMERGAQGAGQSAVRSGFPGSGGGGARGATAGGKPSEPNGITNADLLPDR
ncbi:MAG: DotA/TraY family protein [Rhodocyclaceae bacterium]|nr:DotA/TraY family protein [Rhodocyclaceae bacterium]